MSNPTKQYLGDSVYVQAVGPSIVVTVEDGISVSDTVYFEADNLYAFLIWLDRFQPDFMRKVKANTSE